MLSTYANDGEGIIESLQAICSHPFGCYSHCDKWCDENGNPEKKYASRKHLSDTLMQNDMRKIFHAYIKHPDNELS